MDRRQAAMGDGEHGQLRNGLGLAGGATPASDSVRESGEAPQTGAGQANSDQAGSMTTAPLEVVRSTEFVFEPFLGSLIQLPAVRMQRAQSSEFFLPQSQVRVSAEQVIAPLEQEAALPPTVTASLLTTRPAEEEEKAAEPELLASQPVSEVAEDQDAARAAWEAEEIEPVFARTKIAEEEKPPKKKEKLSLAMRLQRWIVGDLPEIDEDRRRAERTSLPGLVAFYWSGGTPKPHEIVNISKTGLYLRTSELWSLETLVRMTLQRPVTDKKQKRESISVLARVVRIDKGGVGHEFVTAEALRNARSMDVMPSRGTDWKELDRFLEAG
jgi:hypothetical protein